MKLICPACSAQMEGEVLPGELVDCPSCGATFEARPVRAPATADDMLRRAERLAAERRMDEAFDDLDRRKRAEKFDRAIAATDRFGKGASKIGCNLLLGVLFLPILLYALFILVSLLFS